jgi:hypothetical protein
MTKLFSGLAFGGLAAALALGGSLAASTDAEAKKYHSGNYWVKKYAGIDNFSGPKGCSHHYAKWEATGNWKHYSRWQRCIHDR